MALLIYCNHVIVAGKPLQEAFQNEPYHPGASPWNGAQALVFTPDPLLLYERTTSVVVVLYQNEEQPFFCWHEDREELESDDIHITYQSDYEELVNELATRYGLDVNAPIWYAWPGDLPHPQVCLHCGSPYETGSEKDDLFCSDACFEVH